MKPSQLPVLLRHQQGASLSSMLFCLVLIGFVVLLGFKLYPAYINDWKLESVLKNLSQEPALTKKSKREIIGLLNKRFDINSIDSLDRKDLKVVTKPGLVKIKVSYDVQIPLISNLQLLAHFEHDQKVVSP